MSDRAILEVSDVGKTLHSAGGEANEILRGMSLRLGAREFVSIVGPSGVGKTTLLRTISGLAAPDQGSISHGDGSVVHGVPSWLSVVFQDYTKTLFPWLTVTKNLRLAIREVPKAEAHDRIEDMLARVGLHGAGDRYPWELSGGMQQRVALARALVSNPELIVMDEPFASVDALTKFKLEDMVLSLWEQARVAVLLVTHDIDEAVYLSDRVLVLSGKPAAITKELIVDLPRPRVQTTTRGESRFHELRDALLEMVGDLQVGAPADHQP